MDTSSHLAIKPRMPRLSTTEEEAQYERLVAEFTATPTPFLTLLNRAGSRITDLVQKVFDDSIVRAHFSDRRAFVSCEDVTSTEVAVACLASGLGLEPSEDAIVTVLEYIATHGRTLIVLDNIDAIYSYTDPEQERATSLLLTTLVAVNDLTLVITFGGAPLPETIVWTMMDDATDERAKSEPEATNHTQAASALAVSACAPVDATQDSNRPSSPHEASIAAFRDGTLASTRFVAAEAGVVRTPDEYAPPQISTRPFTLAQSKVLPARPAVFHGRDKELERLIAHTMVPSTAPIGIVGPGGIGKTTLAMKVLHEPRVKQYFGRERFFLTCDGASSVDEVLFNLANKLEITTSQNGALWPAILDNLRSRQRVLLLLDNFESIWSPKDDELREASEVFLAQLAVLDELTLLVTTRGKLLPESFTWANVDTAELDTLSSTAARRTFNDLTCLKPLVLESEPESNALTELLREIDFMPLAITLLARLDDLPSRLLREWSEHYTSVLEADHHDGTRRELSVAVSIKISLAHLRAESADFRPRQLLSVMGYLPVGLFQGVSADLRSTIPNLDLTAQDLLRHSLVYTGVYGELRMLSPVRYYVAACLPMTATTLSAVDEIYINIARSRPSQERCNADGPTYDVELPNIFHVLTAALDWCRDSILVHAIIQLASYCSLRDRCCLLLLQKLAPLVESDAKTKAQFLLNISNHYRGKGEWHLAAQSLEQSAELYAELGDKSLEALARILLSSCIGLMGQFEDSRQQQATSRALARESATADFRYLVKPGEDLVLAEQRFRRSREASQQAGDFRAILKLSSRILEIVEDRGDDTAYTKELELVVPLYEHTQLAKVSVVAKAKLARQYIDSGRTDGVEDLLIDAYAVWSSTNDHNGMAIVAALFADLRYIQGSFQETADLYEAAGKLFEADGIPWIAASCNRAASATRTYIATYD